jgi:prepilin-type N-terminal cleavage/methylation domain-containing protein
MTTQTVNKEKGFTIIEVVLVLAIAALIFLVVFLALPALQRSQRDTQRKNDLSRFSSQLTAYSANHNGNMPTTTGLGAFVSGYLTANGDKFNDPQSGNVYDVSAPATRNAEPGVGKLFYYLNARCSDDGTIGTGSGNRQVAAVIGLEGGGSYCQQNHKQDTIGRC